MKLITLDENEIRKNPYTRLVVSKTTSYHMHTFFEFSICIKGTFTNFINGKEYTIKKGRIILLRPKDKHYFIAESPHVARDIYVLPQTLKYICDSIDCSLYERLCTNPLELNFEISDFDLQNLENKLNYFNNPDNKHPLSLKTRHINSILQILDLWQQGFSEKTTGFPEWLSLLISQINTEKFIDKNVDEVILSTHYSHGYVCREFKKHIGVTIQHYLMEAKFSYAVAMLADNTVSVEQVAEKLNYCAASNFIIAFKNRFGITPSQWRRKSNNLNIKQ